MLALLCELHCGPLQPGSATVYPVEVRQMKRRPAACAHLSDQLARRPSRGSMSLPSTSPVAIPRLTPRAAGKDLRPARPSGEHVDVMSQCATGERYSSTTGQRQSRSVL